MTQDQEVKDQEVKDQDQDQEVKKSDKKEPEIKDNDVVYDTVVDGQSIKLTRAQLDQVVYLGLIKATENSEQKKTKTEKEEVKQDPEKGTRKEVAELKAVLTQRDIRQATSDIAEELDECGIESEYFKGIIRQQAFIAVASAIRDDKPYSTKQICKKLIKAHKDELAKQKPKIDIDDKEKDKEKTKFTGSGRTTGQEPKKSLDRHAFRDGRLAKVVASHMDALGEKD